MKANLQRAATDNSTRRAPGRRVIEPGSVIQVWLSSSYADWLPARTIWERLKNSMSAFNTIDPICTALLSGSYLPFFPLSSKRYSDSTQISERPSSSASFQYCSSVLCSE